MADATAYLHPGAFLAQTGGMRPFPVVRLGSRLRARGDFIYGAGGRGRGRIAGTVKKKGDPANVPVSQRVRLYRTRDGLLMRETWSDAQTGAYVFGELDERESFYVVTFDSAGHFRGVMATDLKLENGTLTVV